MSCNSDAPSEDGKLVRVGAVSFSPRLPRPLGLTAIIPSTTVGSWVSKETHMRLWSPCTMLLKCLETVKVTWVRRQRNCSLRVDFWLQWQR